MVTLKIRSLTPLCIHKNQKMILQNKSNPLQLNAKQKLKTMTQSDVELLTLLQLDTIRNLATSEGLESIRALYHDVADNIYKRCCETMEQINDLKQEEYERRFILTDKTTTYITNLIRKEQESKVLLRK